MIIISLDYLLTGNVLRVPGPLTGDGELLLQLLGLLLHLLTFQECSFKGESQCKNVHTSVSEALFLTKNVCSFASCAGQFHLLGEIPLLKSFREIPTRS